MQFLYSVIRGSLENHLDRAEVVVKTPAGDLETDPDPQVEDDEEHLLEGEGITYIKEKDHLKLAAHRAHCVAITTCSMISFVRNRRHNSLQLQNSIRFLACGVSERMNEYLHFLGLTSSRQTAISALRSLSSHAAESVKSIMAISPSGPAIGPFICLDNLDMEEKVHMSSVGHRSMTFHGAWGYIHLPHKSLLKSLDPSELNLSAYQKAVNQLSTTVIDPQLLMPSNSDFNHYELVMKSQIAHAMNQYLETPSHWDGAFPLDPPTIEQISCDKPTIVMLKLMEESDNSAEGIGQVLEAIWGQTGLEPDQFFTRLQPMDADLGTCQNFNSLRDIRHPSENPENNLNNVVFQLGASHTLWNIAQAIFTAHFGDSSNEEDLGAWRSLSSLGIPPEKVIQKKDYTAMVQHMEKVHEATLVHCLRLVIQSEAEDDDRLLNKSTVEVNPLPIEPQQITVDEWNMRINKCYDRFCSPESRRRATVSESPKLHNVLVRLHEFSTVIESNRAMKAGDIGRLINVWKIWLFMTQSLKGLTHYSSYLPRLIISLNSILPSSLSKLMRHSLLVSPSGRPGHFVAKDFLLETQNYWLKYFYNRGGIGTDVQRLKELFSLNLPLR
ncbi:hypothetical protein PCANC_11349 [Puccinia coronata f. sp. avenae]|uniref:DUF6589 domain-containing protein n=1 Tax=Puccinia coronata f. sp. avenae TaxID=200324 RepID=A0A2N5VT37_9BASI|nr:hypothetical protein PCANC_11349 [Puccinia coronata f. sp. avenae]